MSAILYCRVSSEDQIRRNTQNLPTQERKCREFARSEGLEILRVFVDEGKSARTTDRPALQELLKFCRAQRAKVTHVIVADLSRLARSVTDQGVLMALLKGMKIEVRSVDEPMLDGTAAGQLATNMLGAMNQYHSDVLSERVRYRMQACVKQGRHVWRAPLGYLNVQNNGTKGLAIDQERAQLVRHAFQLVAAGNHTTDAILRTVTAMGLRSKRGNPVPKQSFMQMLRNPVYAGFVVSGELKARGLHTPIVSEEVFGQVQAVLDGKNVKVPHKRQNELFPLRGFVRCGGCDKALTAGAAQGRKKKYERYWCWSKNCPSPVGVSADELHEQFTQLLGIYQPSTELLTELPEIARRNWENRRDHIKEQRRQFSERQSQNEALNRSAIKAKLEGKLSDEDFATMKESIKLEAAAIEEQRNLLDSEAATMQELIDGSQRYYLNLAQSWMKAGVNEKQQLQNAVFPDGLAYSVKSRFFEPQNSSIWADVRALLDELDVRSETWVTERSGDIGYTFRPEGGGEGMPWKESSVMDERMRFVIRLKDGETMAALCREFGISRKTGYKIFERYEQCGLEGLSDRTRRPFRYANQLPEPVEVAIVRAKREKPHWGARKIRERLLRRLPHAIRIPAASTIHAVLDRHGLVQPMGRRRPRAEGTPLSEGLHPNDLWCTDYKGEFQLHDKRYCYPLTVTDYSSRFLLLCEAMESNREELAFPAFERLFRERGLPRAIRSDNGVPFASPHGLFQLSKLSVWWLRLGISIERIRPGHPQQNGRHERMHLTLKKEATRPAGVNILQQQARFDTFLQEFNHERPHEALGMKCPAEIYSASCRPYRGIPEPHYPFHDRTVVVTSCGRLCLYNKKINLSVSLAGQAVGVKEVDHGIWLVTFMDYDLGYIDLEEKTLQPLQNPFGPKV